MTFRYFEGSSQQIKHAYNNISDTKKKQKTVKKKIDK